jgi:hypothetical protein
MTSLAQARVEAPLGTRRGTLVAASAGLLYPVLGVASVVLTDEFDLPSWTSPTGAIADYYAGLTYGPGFVTGIAAGALSFLLSLVFVVKLAELLGGVDGGATWVRSLIIGLAVVSVTLTLAFLATTATAVFWGSHGGLSTDGYLTLHGLAFACYWLTLPAIALESATVGLAIVVTSLFPRWLGWVAIAIAVANGIGFFLPSGLWNAVSGLPILWTFAMAVVLLARADRYSHAVAAPHDRPAPA